jgi:hypothetical protein
MSKRAEQKALEAYPVLFSERDGYPSPMPDRRNAFVKGYEQAEKDLALTWEDIRAIDELLTLVYDPDNEKDYYTRVLEEFNKRMQEK